MSVSMMPPTAARPEETLVAVVDALAAEVPADLPGSVSLERTRILLAQGDRMRTLALQGCPSTGDPLVPHHGNLFSQCGTTSVADSLPFCKQDHHHLHDDRMVLKLKDGRWIGPDGWAGPVAPAVDDEAWPDSG